jgi:hypothetical protein
MAAATSIATTASIATTTKEEFVSKINFNELYNNLNKLYELYPELTKLIIYDFENNLSENIIKYSPLFNINKLVKKMKIEKLNKEIIKTNTWIEFSIKNQEKTNLNKNFQKYCIENNLHPNIVNQKLLETENKTISKKQLKKLIYLYNKKNNNHNQQMQID